MRKGWSCVCMYGLVRWGTERSQFLNGMDWQRVIGGVIDVVMVSKHVCMIRALVLTA
jgi:hypothetical protein